MKAGKPKILSRRPQGRCGGGVKDAVNPGTVTSSLIETAGGGEVCVFGGRIRLTGY